MPAEIALRPLDPSDGPSIAQLSRETPDTGAVRFYSEFHHDAYRTMMALTQVRGALLPRRPIGWLTVPAEAWSAPSRRCSSATASSRRLGLAVQHTSHGRAHPRRGGADRGRRTP